VLAGRLKRWCPSAALLRLQCAAVRDYYQGDTIGWSSCPHAPCEQVRLDQPTAARRGGVGQQSVGAFWLTNLTENRYLEAVGHKSAWLDDRLTAFHRIIGAGPPEKLAVGQSVSNPEPGVRASGRKR